MRKFFIFSLLGLFCFACKTTVPANDSIMPNITVSLTEDSGSAIIASTDSNVTLAPIGCPVGTDKEGQLAYYVTDVVGNTIKYVVQANDQGGVKYMFVNVLHNQVSNIRALNSPSVQPNITRINNQVRFSFTFDEPRTAQIIAFEVTNAGTGLNIETSAKDFSDNTIAIPAINSNDPRIQILDISLCDN